MPATAHLNDLLAHLERVCDRTNEEALDLNLVEQSRFILQSPGVRPSDVLELANLSLTLLRSSTDDLEPLVRLLAQAIELVTFDDLRSSIPVNVVIEGLSSPSPSVQGLSLSYLKKAAESPSGAAFVANDNALVKALITTLLTSESAEIGGTQALEAIIALLLIDSPEQVTTECDSDSRGHTKGQGLLWRRMFQDKEIYDLFFRFTSAGDPGHVMSRSAITTAQARLLDLVSGAVKMRWDVVHDQPKFDLHAANPAPVKDSRESGLLNYAALFMVDRTDPLMTNIHVDFLTRLLTLRNPGGCLSIASIPAASSPALEFLLATRLHQRTTDYYLRSGDFDASELHFLEGAQTRYICTYSGLYPEHLLQSTELAQGLIKSLNTNLQMSGARWAHGPSPVQDLNILGHLPVTALMIASKSEGNPLLHLPTNPANVEALKTLAMVFSGRNADDKEASQDLAVQSDPFSKTSRATSARSLFYQYHDSHPEFWSNVGAAMNVLAMPQAASAAIGLVRGILCASWARMGNEPEANSPFSSEENLKELCGGNVSDSGIAEVLNAGESVIQSLLTPLQTMGGDAEAAKLAWRLGREKFDVVALMNDMIQRRVGKAEVSDPVWQSAAKRIQERIALDRSGGSTAQTNLVGSIGR